MNAMTQPIRVILNTREPGFRAKTYLAYVALFTLLAGDAVRYSVGWWGWGAVLVTLFGFTLYNLGKVTEANREAMDDLAMGIYNCGTLLGNE